MIRFGNVTPICCLLAAAGLAMAQPTTPPAPAPAPAPRPMARVDLQDLDVQTLVDVDVQNVIDRAMAKVDLDALNEQATRAAEMAMDKQTLIDDFKRNAKDFSKNFGKDFAEDMAMQAADMKFQMKFDMGKMLAFAQQTPIAPKAPTAPVAPMAPMRGLTEGQFRLGRGSAETRPGRGSADTLYDRGQRALDSHAFDTALDSFTEVVNRGGDRADAALYWKAYTLNKLGRRDEANAALTELRTKFASSRWLDDAKALEIEVKQGSGQKVTPESQSDDELKLLALNGIAQSDPDRAIPILEKLLKGTQAPRVKREAIFVLANNTSPKAQQLLEQIARGGGNPDMQLQAIQYIGRTNRTTDRSALLLQIYGSTTDMAVKHAILNAMASNKDKQWLVQLAQNEKNADMRLDVIRMFGSTADQAKLWQFYQTETDPAAKMEILRLLSGNTEKLTEVARTEKDAKLRRAAIQMLGSVRSTNTSDALVSIYSADQDQQVKHSIINSLYAQKNVTALVQLGRKEGDIELKREIVSRLANMHTPEANQFLEEILK